MVWYSKPKLDVICSVILTGGISSETVEKIEKLALEIHWKSALDIL